MEQLELFCLTNVFGAATPMQSTKWQKNFVKENFAI